jgi:hypothetical protein
MRKCIAPHVAELVCRRKVYFFPDEPSVWLLARQHGWVATVRRVTW